MSHITESPTISYPLTSSQLEIYFDQSRDPSSTAYNTGGYGVINSKLNVEAMRQAIDTVINQHDVFHIAFKEEGEQIVQTFEPTPTKMEYLEFDHYEAPQVEARKWVESQFKKVFQLNQQGLYATYILKVAEEEYWLVLYAHHLILDGLSYGIWTENIFSHYFELTGEYVEESKQQPTQFYDLAQKSYKYVESKSYTKSAEFWESQLEQPFEPVIKPQHTPKPNENNTCMVSKVICPEHYQRLIEFSESINATIHQLFIGTLYSYFASCYGSKVIPVCLPFHNRTGPAKRAIGCFASVSPLLMTIDSSMTFVELVSELNEKLKSISRHTKYPMSKVFQRARATQPHISNLFDINFNYYKVAFDIDPSVEVNSLRTGSQPPFKFHLCEFRDQQDIQIQIEAQNEYFTEQEASQILERIMLMVEQIVTNPKIRLDQLQLLSKQDTACYEQLNNLSNISTSNSADNFVDMFECQVKATPQATALVFNQQALTFAELNSKANKLASKIQSLLPVDRAADVPAIGLCAQRSIEMVIGLLGILKAGAAYVPVDPKAPAERVRYIADNAQIKVVVSDHKSSVLMPGFIEHTLLIDEALEEHWLEQFDSNNPAVNIRAEDTAYIIYTSGSTGRPKGVNVNHSNVTHLQQAMNQVLAEQELEAPFRWAWNAPLHFDASVQALTALVKGAQLHLLDDEHRANPTMLVTYLEENDIDLLDITPTLLELLIKEADRQKTPLPNLLVGGEAISPSLWQQIAAQSEHSGRFALNVYGPTECTVNSTFASINSNCEPSIGTSIPGCRLFVLGDKQQLLPTGVIGELAIGGAGLATGYANNPELTAKQFIDHPVYGRVYMSGDLACLGENGKLEYKGRTDHQIKLRGHRIELEEIEDVLCRYSGVSETAVILNNQQLHAFIVAEGVQESELYRHIENVLPDYMQVSRIDFIPNIPITSNGKKDRKQLAAMEFESNSSQYIAPETETQNEIQKIWHKLMARDSISIEDNFFDIGGHSLMAIRVASACRDIFKVEVKLSDFMEAPTIKQLSELITQSMDSQRAASKVIHANLNQENKQRIIL
ncbi:amino acid adenylation domain-containing protein [Shewanella waksmanii]|uniref:non-ribosomal peptide synthetase n=1 Tax=Shewanella waksmanii TaxID=213783 RepID=UPI003736C07E